MITGLPNLLTLSRILVIPAIVAAFYLDGTAANWTTFGLFIAAGITDYFDGYLARVRSQQSAFGRFLDPIADKLLVGAAILMMAAFDRFTGLVILPAMVILLREILISGLREFLAQVQIPVPVTRLAKWKTTVQFVALALLLLGNAVSWAHDVGSAALWLAALLTLYTGYGYLSSGLRHIGASDRDEKSAMQNRTASGSVDQ
jgi:cardiolipin synthase